MYAYVPLPQGSTVWKAVRAGLALTSCAPWGTTARRAPPPPTGHLALPARRGNNWARQVGQPAGGVQRDASVLKVRTEEEC